MTKPPATEFEKFKSMMGRLMRVPKAELDRREDAYKKSRPPATKRTPKPKPA